MLRGLPPALRLCAVGGGGGAAGGGEAGAGGGEAGAGEVPEGWGGLGEGGAGQRPGERSGHARQVRDTTGPSALNMGPYSGPIPIELEVMGRGR